METTALNQAQVQLLEMLSFVQTPETWGELKQVISDYFAKKAQMEIDHLWETGELDEAKVEGFRHLHERTTYK